MEEYETMVLELDGSSVEQSLADVGQAIKEIKALVEETGMAISKAVASMVQSIKSVETSLSSLTKSLTLATETLQRFLDTINSGTSTDKWMKSASNLSEDMAVLGDVVGAVVGSVLGAVASVGVEQLLSAVISKLAATLEITGAAAAGIATGAGVTVAAIIAAIAAIIIHWDDLTAFFVNTRQLLQEESAGIAQIFQSVQQAAADMNQSVYESWQIYGASILQQQDSFKSGVESLWEYITVSIIEPVLAIWAKVYDELWEEHLKPLWDRIVKATMSISENCLILWNDVLKPIIDWLTTILAPVIITVVNAVMDIIAVAIGTISDVIGALFTVLDGVIQFVIGVFTLDWKRAWEGVLKVVVGVFEVIGGIIGGLWDAVMWIVETIGNALSSLIVGAINAIGGLIGGIGSLFGQEDWGFSVPVNTTTIPYLAKGAVLPANRPFLAVVGDQKHGTNVEAPLTTIQEAVAAVLGDKLSGMMAGFEAVVAEQRATREVVESIRIGDEAIAMAAQRYNRKMAVVRGTAW